MAQCCPSAVPGSYIDLITHGEVLSRLDSTAVKQGEDLVRESRASEDDEDENFFVHQKQIPRRVAVFTMVMMMMMLMMMLMMLVMTMMVMIVMMMMMMVLLLMMMMTMMIMVMLVMMMMMMMIMLMIIIMVLDSCGGASEGPLVPFWKHFGVLLR